MSDTPTLEKVTPTLGSHVRLDLTQHDLVNAAIYMETEPLEREKAGFSTERDRLEVVHSRLKQDLYNLALAQEKRIRDEATVEWLPAATKWFFHGGQVAPRLTVEASVDRGNTPMVKVLIERDGQSPLATTYQFHSEEAQRIVQLISENTAKLQEVHLQLSALNKKIKNINGSRNRRLAIITTELMGQTPNRYETDGGD